MAIAKKGSRKIIIDDIEYLYKISKIKQESDWREQNNELSERFMKYARYYGLGQVKDVTINIFIQLKENPISNCFVTISTILIDSFFGPEQITQIKPKFVAELIRHALVNGWQPTEKGDFKINVLETKKEGEKSYQIL